MKVIVVLAVMIAIGAAFPSGETKPEIQSELNPESKADEQKNALLEADANPQGDNSQSEAERQKRFIFFSPFFYPYAYTSYVVSPTLIETPTVVGTPVVATKTKVRVSAPFVSVAV